MKSSAYLSSTMSTLGNILNRRQIDDILLIFPSETGFDISCKLSPTETICMKYQNLLLGKNKKTISNLSPAELVRGVIKLKICFYLVDILLQVFQVSLKT